MFYDTHAHLDFPDFSEDLPLVLARAREAGVSRIITIGTDLESSRRAIALADQFPEVFAVAGWHPGHVTSAPADLRQELRDWAAHPKVVALGETGLDYYRLPSSQSGTPEEDITYKRRQAELFQQHLEIASECGLNVVVHQRAALEDTLALFKPYANRVRAVFHCFGESLEVLRRITALGSLVSFTGIITFKSAELVRQTVQAAASDQFMLETDCPYLAPVPHRGKRCEPAFVRDTAAAIAAIRKCSIDRLAEATSAVAHKFFPKLH